MRRKLETVKKTISRTISFVLALMVLVSSLPYIPLVSNALTPSPSYPETQTGFKDLNAFQNTKWNNILDQTFTPQITSSAVPSLDDVKNNNIQVKDTSPYFGWKKDLPSTVSSWDGTATEVTSGEEIISYAGESVDAGNGLGEKINNKYTGKYTQEDFTVTYKVYNVSNAAELRYAMEQTPSASENIKINICNDIDLNGKESFWEPIILKSNTSWVYIEGNGHTIYNMKSYSVPLEKAFASVNDGYAGFIGIVDHRKFVMKNLNFSNCLVFSKSSRSGIAIGYNYYSRIYLENVNIYDSFIYGKGSNISTLVGRTDSPPGSFIRNCSSKNCYVYGTDHTAGLVGTLWMLSGTFKVKYNVDFPSSPEAWINKTDNVYPLMFENNFSVDCTVFSTGGDSGGLISCGSKMICRNSFTNNIMYGNKITGDFIGRIVTHSSGAGFYDDNNKMTLGTYFENCYSSGIIEGNTQIGGFTGLDDGTPNKTNGVTVYKNCYSTAMVGMDYAGSRLGGFVGHEDSYSEPIASIIIGYDENGEEIYTDHPGSIYINCYAAGEVGNIQTNTDAAQTGTYNYLGGFTGYTCGYSSEYGLGTPYKNTETNGVYINCYYDMQTTGMRERAAGKSDQFYVSDFSDIDSAINATSALTDTERDNLIKLRADYVDKMENNNDESYNIDLTPIDNALDSITDAQKEKLIALKNQIQALDSMIDIHAINDVVNIVNYTDSQKIEKLTGLENEINKVLSDEELTIPDISIIDTIVEKENLSTNPNATLDDDMAQLKILRDKVQKLVDNGFYPSNVGIITLKDICGFITTDEGNNLTAFQTALTTLLKSDENKNKIDETITNATDEKIYKNYTLDEMCEALSSVIANKNKEYISEEENSKLIALREVLIDSDFWNDTVFSNAKAFSSIATVTSLLTKDKQDRLNSVKGNFTSKYHQIDLTIIDSILSNTTNTGMLTDAQKVKLIDLKSELSTYLNGKVDYSIIDDLLYPISDEEKAALLNLKAQLAGSHPEIDTSIIDEVTGNDSTLPLTEQEKQALQALKDQSLLYASQIPGVTGVYTQHSEDKGVEGLADTVDMGDDTAWQNGSKDDMYPALKVFYDKDTIKDHFGINAKRLGTDVIEGDETDQRITAQLNEKAELVENYARASVSTVLLDHWDSAMNMDTGTLSEENAWKTGLEQNKFTKVEYAATDRWDKDTDNMYWEKTYTNLAAGSYEFKVQQGTAWAYNFGTDKFNGDNCVLTVPQDCDVKIKFDYVPNVSDSGADTNFRIWAEFYDADGNKIGDQELGKNINDTVQNTWIVAGSFSGWNNSDEAYKLYYIGNSVYSNTIKPFELKAGTYEFKIVQKGNWSESYGKSGGSANMSFTLSKDSSVIFAFDENTKLTTITATTDGALTDVQTENEKVTYPKYALIGTQAIMGYEWIESPQSVVACAMTETVDGSGIYTKTFTVSKENFNNNYGYKVIKDGVDVGIRKYYRIATADETIESVKLTFTYNSATDTTTIESSNSGVEIILDPQLGSYGVLGGETLTGYNWGKDTSDTFIPGTNPMEYNSSSKTYSITFQDVPAGTHEFKVVGNSDWDSHIDYGSNIDGNNYKLITTKTSDITIVFNEETKHITVTSNPEDAIYEESYVVCGNENLTGVNKSTISEDNKMVFEKETGLYKIVYDNLTSDADKNYSFKVVFYGKNNNEDYKAFRVYSDTPDDTEIYHLEVTYNPTTKTSDYRLFNSSDEDVTETTIKEPNIEFYAVAGDEALTGYNWLDDSIYEAAVAAGKMTYNENTNKYSVTFYDVDVTPTAESLSFKIVANASWASGIDYGKANGDNYVITLRSDQTTKCNVTITFDKDTHKIEVEAIGKTDSGEFVNCQSVIDEQTFEWFVCGVYNLVSDDIYNTPKTVYDTVRDITASFSFTTYYQKMNWQNDVARNEENGFFEYLNKKDDGTSGFNLDYTVQGKKITGNFNVPVIDIKKEVVVVEENGVVTDTYDAYSCSNFMPGKQWVTVSTGDTTDTTKGRRYLRLIPTAYLEAGMDSDINVLQASSDKDEKYVYNIVTYTNNSEYNTFKLKNSDGTVGETFDENTYFSRYNFALTAGYAITDVNGLGYYGSYSKQKIQTYAENQRRANTLNTSNKEAYFVMTSAFAQTESYDDTVISEGATTNLLVDELVDQSLIGSSYDDGTNYAKTIVKIYKGSNKVFMDSNSETTKVEEYDNYLKWTGQKPFDLDDVGTYTVKYFWSLSDGRYLTDSKTVNITPSEYDITKTVDKSYIEKNTNANDKELTYTVTYTNKNAGDFTICDVLPFDGDKRYNTKSNDNISSSNMKNSTLTLKNIEVSYSSVENAEGDSPPTVNDIQIYYNTDTSVRSYIDTNGKPIDKFVNSINLEDGSWTKVDSPFEGDVSKPTALVVTGKQAGAGTTQVTLTYTVEIQNTDFECLYVNNAFFSANNDTAITEQLAEKPMVIGYSQPAITAVVARKLSGYVWYDVDFDGKYNSSSEPPIQGVKVTLMKKQGDEYVSTGNSMYTDEKGYYHFDDIYPEGDYRVYFEPEQDPEDSTKFKTVTIKYSAINSSKADETVEFTDDNLKLSKTLSVYQVDDKNGSRNIAKQDGENTAYYIDESMPTAEGIFNNNNQPRYQNGSVSNYYFQREFQNLALRTPLDDHACSLTVKKVESGTDTTLAGVQFKLEYQLADSENYQSLYVEKIYNTNGEVVEYKFVKPTTDSEGQTVYEYQYDTGTVVQENVVEANGIETDENGLIKFTGLPSDAQYKLSEVGTLDGYNLLAVPLEFTLPYYIANNSDGSVGTTSPDGFVQAQTGTTYPGADGTYYYDVTYTVTNSKIPAMPLTGVENNIVLIVIAAVMLTMGIAVFFVFKVVKWRKKSQNSTTK